MRAQPDKLRIYSRGPAFQYAVSLGAIAIASGVLAEWLDLAQLYVLSPIIAVPAVIHAVRWLSQPRVLIDRTAQVIKFGRDRVPWSVFRGVACDYEIRHLGPGNGADHIYTIYLVRNDGYDPKVVALRSTDRGARTLTHRVAAMLGLPVLSCDDD